MRTEPRKRYYQLKVLAEIDEALIGKIKANGDDEATTLDWVVAAIHRRLVAPFGDELKPVPVREVTVEDIWIVAEDEHGLLREWWGEPKWKPND